MTHTHIARTEHIFRERAERGLTEKKMKNQKREEERRKRKKEKSKKAEKAHLIHRSLVTYLLILIVYNNIGDK